MRASASMSASTSSSSVAASASEAVSRLLQLRRGTPASDRLAASQQAYVLLSEWQDALNVSQGRGETREAKLLEDTLTRFGVEMRRLETNARSSLAKGSGRGAGAAAAERLRSVCRGFARLCTHAGRRLKLAQRRRGVAAEEQKRLRGRRRGTGSEAAPVEREIPIARLRAQCPLYATHGPRHLCAHQCFLREHEPFRKFRALLDAAARNGLCVDGWFTRLHAYAEEAPSPSGDRGGGTPGCCSAEQALRFEVRYVAPDGTSHGSLSSALRALGGPPPTAALPPPPQTPPLRSPSPAGMAGLAARVAESSPRQHDAWHPMPSPFGLLEELFGRAPWRLLVACMLLNQTHRRQVDGVLFRLLEACPTPEALLRAPQDTIQAMLRPLGLQRRRCDALRRLSADFIQLRCAMPEIGRGLPKGRQGEGGALEGTAEGSEGHGGGENGAGERSCGQGPEAVLEGVRTIHGVGPYAADAFAMFVLGRFDRQRPPRDHALRWYHEFVVGATSQGTGVASQTDAQSHARTHTQKA